MYWASQFLNSQQYPLPDKRIIQCVASIFLLNFLQSIYLKSLKVWKCKKNVAWNFHFLHCQFLILEVRRFICIKIWTWFAYIEKCCWSINCYIHMFYKLRTSQVVHTTLKVWPEFEKRNESIMAIYSYLIGSIYQIGRVGIESKFGSISKAFYSHSS